MGKERWFTGLSMSFSLLKIIAETNVFALGVQGRNRGFLPLIATWKPSTSFSMPISVKTFFFLAMDVELIFWCNKYAKRISRFQMQNYAFRLYKVIEELWESQVKGSAWDLNNKRISYSMLLYRRKNQQGTCIHFSYTLTLWPQIINYSTISN